MQRTQMNVRGTMATTPCVDRARAVNAGRVPYTASWHRMRYWGGYMYLARFKVQSLRHGCTAPPRTTTGTRSDFTHAHARNTARRPRTGHSCIMRHASPAPCYIHPTTHPLHPTKTAPHTSCTLHSVRGHTCRLRVAGTPPRAAPKSAPWPRCCPAPRPPLPLDRPLPRRSGRRSAWARCRA